jgi:hypothetical protein
MATFRNPGVETRILFLSSQRVEAVWTVNSVKFQMFFLCTFGAYDRMHDLEVNLPYCRLTNSLMMHGRNNGKKLMAVRIVKHAMEIIYLLTDQNPIQVIVDAIINRCVCVCGSLTSMA